MKKSILIIVAAALALVSCLKVETYEGSGFPKYEESDYPVSFSWYARRTLYSGPVTAPTRANPDYFIGGTSGSIGEAHLNDGTAMGVFGYFHPQDHGSQGTWKHGVGVYNAPNLFYNEQVTITDEGGSYSYAYANDRYWPKNPLDRISFIAYYPWNALNTSGSATDETIVEPFLDTQSKREGMVGFYYVVPEKSEDQIDFCVSDLCLEQSKALWDTDHTQGLTIGAETSVTDNSGTVKFFFHHALSQVRIKSVNFDKAGNDSLDVDIKYILFSGVPVYGQCIPVPDFSSTTATGRTTVTPTWPVGSLVNRRPNLTSGVRANVCYDSGTWDADNFLLMIPHEFKVDAKIVVNFDVKRRKGEVDGNTGGEYYAYENNTLEATLTTNTVYGWEAGKIYTYNITLDLKQIKVTADVEPWLDAGEDVIMDN
ncbi:MAG: fimbrillin family protein [Bacteroidales bacterium]|nr:fimbrillin family protein [Bacteroidales bacterium]